MVKNSKFDFPIKLLVGIIIDVFSKKLINLNNITIKEIDMQRVATLAQLSITGAGQRSKESKVKRAVQEVANSLLESEEIFTSADVGQAQSGFYFFTESTKLKTNHCKNSKIYNLYCLTSVPTEREPKYLRKG